MAAPICGRYKISLVIGTWPPPSATPMSARKDSAPCTPKRIRGPDEMSDSRRESAGRASGDAELNGWWERWLGHRDMKARERLIVHYSPLVKFVAGRVGAGLPSSVDPGDLVSAGVFGLIDAVERFDSDRGVKFETFAVPRIRGAIFDGLRSLDWVPRSVRSRAREVETAFHDLEARFGRSPSEEELSSHLGLTSTEFQRWLAAIASTTVGPLDRALVAGAETRPLPRGTPPSPAGTVEGARLPRPLRGEGCRPPPPERAGLVVLFDQGPAAAGVGGGPG